MKHIIAFLACLAIVAVGNPAYAQENPKELALKLGSRSYAERESAAKKLEQLGAAALPALRASVSSADLETKRRAVMVMERIEDRMLQDEVVQASPLRLQFQDESAAKAVSEVARQTGLRLGGVQGKTRITVDRGNLPYWRAFREFRKAAQLGEFDFARVGANLKRLGAEEGRDLAGRLRLLDGDRRPPLWLPMLELTEPGSDGYAEDDSHSVRVRVRWHSLQRFVPDKQDYGVFAVEVRREPRLQLAAVPLVEITKIIDEKGRERPVQGVNFFSDNIGDEDVKLLRAFVGEVQFNGLVHLKTTRWEGPMRPLKEVHGHVRLEVLGRPRLIEAPRVFEAQGKEFRSFAGPTLKILEAKRQDLRLRVRFDHLDGLLPKNGTPPVIRVRPGVLAVQGPMDIALERIELVDARGWKCKPIEMRYEQAADGKGYVADISFEAPIRATDDLTLVMTKEPRRVMVDVPFLVRGVPLSGKN